MFLLGCTCARRALPSNRREVQTIVQAHGQNVAVVAPDYRLVTERARALTVALE